MLRELIQFRAIQHSDQMGQGRLLKHSVRIVLNCSYIWFPLPCCPFIFQLNLWPRGQLINPLPDVFTCLLAWFDLCRSLPLASLILTQGSESRLITRGKYTRHQHDNWTVAELALCFSSRIYKKLNTIETTNSWLGLHLYSHETTHLNTGEKAVHGSLHTWSLTLL